MSLHNRHDFVFFFDVRDGNPNGDPDAGNQPRMDAETGQGLVTDVCLKRKIRNFVSLTHKEKSPFDIYVKEKAVLNRQNERAYSELNLKPETKKLPKKEADAKALTQWMCDTFYDIRTFGAVMTTAVNTGQVRGPVQMTFSRSVDPVISAEHSITRMAVTKEEHRGKERTMGRKCTVPYGLYRCHGFISAHLAQQTGFGKEDLELFFNALEQMFDHDRSASRGEMAARALLVFKHDSALGNAPAHALFDRISVEKTKSGDEPVRNIKDYRLDIDEDLPTGVSLIKRIIW